MNELGTPRLYRVPPQGRTLAQRARDHQATAGRRETWGYPAYDERSPGRAGFNCGMAYGLWGVPPQRAEQLAALAQHLTAHAMTVVRAPRVIVTAVLLADTATVSVLGLRGRPTDITDPGTSPAVRRAAESWGVLNLAAGPCLYASTSLAPAQTATPAPPVNRNSR